MITMEAKKMYSVFTAFEHDSLKAICFIKSPIVLVGFQGNDILCNVDADVYESVIKILEHAIIATDLALYFK